MHSTTHNVDEHLAGCRLTINHAALCENWRTLNRATPGARTAGVVKANGYGLGLGEIGLSLAAAGCEVFFVANPDEGLRLRRVLKSREIFVFSGLTERNAAVYAESNLIPVLNRFEDINIWSKFWSLRGSRRPCALQLDTGMNRLGLSGAEFERLLGDKTLMQSINIITILSHLACADDKDNPMNKNQLTDFKRLTRSVTNTELSLANSAGIGLGADYHFNMVRPGIALYGGECSQNQENLLSAVVSASARIVQIRQVQKGETIGYGATHTFDRDGTVAIVATGYADGYHRTLSGTGIVKPNPTGKGAFGAIAGQLVPVLGLVSMDLTAFDVTDISPQIFKSEGWIELFGPTVKLDDAARATGTIGYELLTSLGQRYHRIHINQPEHSPNG